MKLSIDNYLYIQTPFHKRPDEVIPQTINFCCLTDYFHYV